MIRHFLLPQSLENVSVIGNIRQWDMHSYSSHNIFANDNEIPFTHGIDKRYLTDLKVIHLKQFKG